MSDNRVEYEDDGRVIDELVTHRATVHIERMDEKAYFIVIDTTAGSQRLWMAIGQNGELELTPE